ncbi:hypothetical protein DBR22_15985, partial [Arthrobacter sp. HMWF013]
MAEVTPSGSGGPISLTGPAMDWALEIRGGIGGMTFQLEELIHGAGKLDHLADELAAVEVEVHRIWEDLGAYQNDSRPSGTIALMSVGEAEWSVRAVRDELRRISSQVRASQRDYEAAEVLADLSRGAGAGLGNPGALGRQAGDLWLGHALNGETAEQIVGPLALGVLLAVSPERFAMAVGADLAAGRHIAAAVPLLTGVAGQDIRILQPRAVT